MIYEDIINMPHHVSKKRPSMPMSDRAAQFAPFAALTGYDEAIAETGRLTDGRQEPDEYILEELDLRLSLLQELADSEDGTEVGITYFKKDELKAGGRYLYICGGVKKIRIFERDIIMTDGTRIPIDDILDIALPDNLDSPAG